MNDTFTIYDAKLNLFLVLDINAKIWMWVTFDKLVEDFSYSAVDEKFVEVFLDSIRNNNRGSYDEEFIRPVIDAMPNVWLIKIIDYKVDYTDGIKI